MSIDGIKLTKEDIEKLNEEGNIYETRSDMQNDNSVDVNSKYFGDNGEVYLDNQGRIIEKQEDGSEVYMGWTNYDNISATPSSDNDSVTKQIKDMLNNTDNSNNNKEESVTKQLKEMLNNTDGNNSTITSIETTDSNITKDSTSKDQNNKDNIRITPVVEYKLREGLEELKKEILNQYDGYDKAENNTTNNESNLDFPTAVENVTSQIADAFNLDNETNGTGTIPVTDFSSALYNITAANTDNSTKNYESMQNTDNNDNTLQSEKDVNPVLTENDSNNNNVLKEIIMNNGKPTILIYDENKK